MTTALNRKARRLEQFGPIYQFRNLPCSIQPDSKLWCVSGQYFGGGGVLEWCHDEDDANAVLAKMSQCRGFTKLSANKFTDPEIHVVM